MFDRIAEVYDLVKSHRNYADEANELCRHLTIEGGSVLEVACGTGTLLRLLPQFDRYGIDISQSMLDMAVRKLPSEVVLSREDMTQFNLAMQFDAVLCLDGAIGYNEPQKALPNALCCMVAHTKSGGVLLIEPWYTPFSWRPHHNHVVHHANEDGSLVVVRMAHGSENGAIEFHNLVGNESGIAHFVEHYQFWLHHTETIVELLHEFGARSVDLLEPSEVFSRGLIRANF